MVFEYRFFLTCAAALAWAPSYAGEPLPPVSGDAVIRAQAGDSEIAITTTSRLAGAFHSLTWNGKEFINSADHGRQLQSAANFDAGSPIADETFNPTEAGSRRDGDGPSSTSRLLHRVVTGNALQTTTQMAFWLAPGETSGPHAAKNETRRSNYLLTKRVEIGCRDLPHAIRYDVTFSVPVGERHTVAVFEALTGYMPPEFERFWTFDRETAMLTPLSDGPGEQPHPVAFSTVNGRHAMSCYTPATTDAHAGLNSIAYGRFRFPDEKVVKWNCVFRYANAHSGIAAGEYAFPLYVVIGDLDTVRSSLKRLVRDPKQR